MSKVLINRPVTPVHEEMANLELQTINIDLADQEKIVAKIKNSYRDMASSSKPTLIKVYYDDILGPEEYILNQLILKKNNIIKYLEYPDI